MEGLVPAARDVAEKLKAAGRTVAVAESSAGGLVAASLLALPGASAYFLGGAVIYTRAARAGLLGVTEADMEGMRPSTEPYALLLARRVREKLGADWGFAETGAAGPDGNRYGDAAGHACLAVVGPGVERVTTLETGLTGRAQNMRAFAAALFRLAAEAIE